MAVNSLWKMYWIWTKWYFLHVLDTKYSIWMFSMFSLMWMEIEINTYFQSMIALEKCLIFIPINVALEFWPEFTFIVFIQSGSTPWGTKFITVMYTVQCTIYYRLNFFQVFLILIITLLGNYNYQAKTLDIKKALWGSTTFYFFTKQLLTLDF